MAEAKFRVKFAGPFVTFQDAGRFGQMRFGVPESGPMDMLSFAAANVALGNPEGATVIEVSMGGLSLHCEQGAVTYALAGGDFALEQGDHKGQAWSVHTIHAGETLTIRPGQTGSWTYLAFAGTLDIAPWIGSTATHSLSGLGGGPVTTGAQFSIKDAQVREAREGDFDRPDFLDSAAPIRVVLGPQDRHFAEGAVEGFLNAPYQLTDAYDRMGVRLDGPTLTLGDSLSIPSEPIVKGSIQVSGDGVPTILLADHQTTGGYPKIATVISPDVDRLVQLRAKDRLRFEAVSATEAVQIARAHAAARADYLAAIATPKGTLEQRLMRENLISGMVGDA